MSVPPPSDPNSRPAPPSAPSAPFAPVYPPPPAQPPVWPPAPDAPGFGLAEAPLDNTSGTDGHIPYEIAKLKWNWGAYLLCPLWLMFHGMWPWGVAMLAAAFAGPYWLDHYVHDISAGINIILNIVYIGVAIRGHRSAWRHRRYASLKQYFEVEQKWALWGWIVIAAIVVVVIIGIAVLPK